jgi:MFS family permease
VLLSWGFGATWMHVCSGAVLTRFARSLGMSDAAFGLLAALPYLAALAQLPASLYLERGGRRRALFFRAGVPGRAAWIAIGLVPWLLPRGVWWQALLGLYALAQVLSSAATPSWTSWMADLVPRRLRGRFFSRRNQLGQLIGVTLSPAAGWLLDRAGGASLDALRPLASLLIVGGAAVGLFDHACYAPVPDPAPRRPRAADVPPRVLLEPLRDRNFLRFLGFVGTLVFATGYVGQYLWLYLFDAVGMSNLRANAVLIAAPLLLQVLVYPVWGRLVDRFGRKPVLWICGLMVVHGGAAWVLVTPDTWAWGFAASMVATAAWPGVEIANFNILLGLSESRAGRRHGSAYAAIHSLVVAVAGTLSGAFGGWVAHRLGPEWRATLLGWPLTYHGALMLISAALRLAALGWLAGLEDRRAYGARETLRYMIGGLYSNVQQALLAPGARLLRAGRATFKLRGPRP